VASGIQVQSPARQGAKRRGMQPGEGLHLILTALGAAREWTGVKWKNGRDAHGAPVAIAIIQNAEFSMAQDGETTLRQSGQPKLY
jgi:hypothetical protein